MFRCITVNRRLRSSITGLLSKLGFKPVVMDMIRITLQGLFLFGTVRVEEGPPLLSNISHK